MVARGHRLVRHLLMRAHARACMASQLFKTRAGLPSRARGIICVAWWGWEMLLKAHCMKVHWFRACRVVPDCPSLLLRCSGAPTAIITSLHPDYLSLSSLAI